MDGAQAEGLRPPSGLYQGPGPLGCCSCCRLDCHLHWVHLDAAPVAGWIVWTFGALWGVAPMPTPEAHLRIPVGKTSAREVLEGGGHLPFQVLDASAMEGIRGLAGESSSIYSCIQIFQALTPPAPPPSISWRDGRTY